jgi:hypothetical protein
MREDDLSKIQACCIAKDAAQLGVGRDYQEKYKQGHQPAAVRSWRIENPSLWAKYAAGRQHVADACKTMPAPRVKVRSSFVRATEALHSGKRLYSAVNETYLLHSPAMSALSSILHLGFNEHYSGATSGTAFGDGTYFAEDIGKTDQYAVLDKEWKADNLPDEMKDLHKHLYGKDYPHAGDVFYVLLTRVVQGHQVQTDQAAPHKYKQPNVYAMDGENVRELAAIPGSKPARPYHSLLGTAFPRFREFIVFHPGAQCYPEYLIAYKRSNSAAAAAGQGMMVKLSKGRSHASSGGSSGGGSGSGSSGRGGSSGGSSSSSSSGSSSSSSFSGHRKVPGSSFDVAVNRPCARNTSGGYYSNLEAFKQNSHQLIAVTWSVPSHFVHSDFTSGAALAGEQTGGGLHGLGLKGSGWNFHDCYFEVRFRSHGVLSWRTFSQSDGWTECCLGIAPSGFGRGTRFELIIGSLQPRTEYEVQVRAHNSLGWGKWSEIGSGETRRSWSLGEVAGDTLGAGAAVAGGTVKTFTALSEGEYTKAASVVGRGVMGTAKAAYDAAVDLAK